jgi:hypothetical protein
MPTPRTEDFTDLARKYVRLAEDPDNEGYREQFLNLARVWMEVAIEEASSQFEPETYPDERGRWRV